LPNKAAQALSLQLGNRVIASRGAASPVVIKAIGRFQ
jgi:hypothetical protein